MKLDQDYSLLVGSYSDMDALAHQPYAPKPGKGMYAMTLSVDGKLSLNNTSAALNPAVLIPHTDVETGELEMTDKIFEIPAPNYIRFMNT